MDRPSRAETSRAEGWISSHLSHIMARGACDLATASNLSSDNLIVGTSVLPPAHDMLEIVHALTHPTYVCFEALANYLLIESCRVELCDIVESRGEPRARRCNALTSRGYYDQFHRYVCMYVQVLMHLLHHHDHPLPQPPSDSQYPPESVPLRVRHLQCLQQRHRRAGPSIFRPFSAEGLS